MLQLNLICNKLILHILNKGRVFQIRPFFTIKIICCIIKLNYKRVENKKERKKKKMVESKKIQLTIGGKVVEVETGKNARSAS